MGIICLKYDAGFDGTGQKPEGGAIVNRVINFRIT